MQQLFLYTIKILLSIIDKPYKTINGLQIVEYKVLLWTQLKGQ